MAFNTQEFRAIKHFADKKGVVPQLSTRQSVRFLKKSGEIIEMSISALVSRMLADKKAEKKNRKGK